MEAVPRSSVRLRRTWLITWAMDTFTAKTSPSQQDKYTLMTVVNHQRAAASDGFYIGNLIPNPAV